MAIYERFERPLKVTKRDNFTVTLSDQYLAGEVITSSTVTVQDPILTVETVSNSLNVISALCEGVTVGETKLHYSWSTATRSGCESYIVVVSEC